MKIAVMQPYFLPYIGYFQLINKVERFVFFDDVNFIKKGWINRNNLFGNSGPVSFSIPLSKVSQNKKINDTALNDFEKWSSEFINQVNHIYSKAPQFTLIQKLLSDILESGPFNSIAHLAENSIRLVCDYLGINVQFDSSSKINYEGIDGEQKIISICKSCKADSYINPRNGEHLYNASTFNEQGINIEFHDPKIIPYKQLSGTDFLPGLSILDVLMMNDKDTIQSKLL
jgi:hypothetical protein